MRLGQKAAFSRIDKTAGCEKEIRPEICYYVQGREGRKKVFAFSFLFFFTLFNHQDLPQIPSHPLSSRPPPDGQTSRQLMIKRVGGLLPGGQGLFKAHRLGFLCKGN